MGWITNRAKCDWCNPKHANVDMVMLVDGNATDELTGKPEATPIRQVPPQTSFYKSVERDRMKKGVQTRCP